MDLAGKNREGLAAKNQRLVMGKINFAHGPVKARVQKSSSTGPKNHQLQIETHSTIFLGQSTDGNKIHERNREICFIETE
jgi:hypothetical protein